MAYDWKNKISNTGLLRFCSKVHATQEERRMKESSASESTRLEHEEAGFLHTAVSVKDDRIVRTESELPRVTHAREADALVEESQSSPVSLEEAKLSSSGSSTKRALSSAGLSSPKKRRASGSLKSKLSTPNNQRMISDFFKK